MARVLYQTDTAPVDRGTGSYLGDEPPAGGIGIRRGRA